ncbi:MAG: diguanylate cyclase, partial [Acidobacteriota bacterium]
MAAATFDAAASVLYVGGTPKDGQVAQAALLQPGTEPHEVRWVGTLGAALERLATTHVRAVLLDRQVPDSPGIEGLERLVHAAPAVPVLAIVADDSNAVELLAAGARDVLLASRLDSYWLARAIRYAVDCAQSESAVLAERARTELTLDSIGDGLLTLDESLRITSLNRMAENMTGWVRADAIGERLDGVVQIVNATTREAVTLSGDGALSWRPVLEIAPDNVLIRRNGTELAVEYKAQQFRDVTGRMTGATVVFRDVTTRRALSLQMAHLASHDPLTDLPNRLLLSDRLGRSLEMVRRYKRWLAVLFIDIDRFKYINDSLGHLVGDELIRSVAREITKCVRSSDTVSRHGGDEFVVVLSELEHAEDAA